MDEDYKWAGGRAEREIMDLMVAGGGYCCGGGGKHGGQSERQKTEKQRTLEWWLL